MENMQECPAYILVSPWERYSQSAIVRFQIDHPIGDGGSSRCYEAYHPNSGRGVLKEFWPRELAELERDKDGQVCVSASHKNNAFPFERMMEEYVQSYRKMLEMKQSSDPIARDLSTFVPPYEIFRGCDPMGEHIGTAYIWIPLPEYVTFDQVCENIRKTPTENPQHKLVLVLKSVAELAGCTAALHKQGLLHRDIKPANLGFMMRNTQLLEQTLSFFDLDTVCSCYDIKGVVYSEGFSDPSVLRRWHQHGFADDIYSIGATLFHALVLNVGAKDGYKDENYHDLAQLVEESPLIKACSVYSNPKLKQQLVLILQRCLGNARYKDCEKLQNDLNKALQYIMPIKPDNTGRWVWREAAKQLDKRHYAKNKLALQYHLYCNPLYKCESKNRINVLILGFGYYGQTFMDSCLQMGQLPNKHLTVTVVSDDPLDKRSYLEARPELCRFVNVDGSLDGDLERYADINFIRQRLIYRQNVEKHLIEDDALVELLDKLNGDKAPHYIMIALGDDELNRCAAEKCCDLQGASSSIHFVQEGRPLFTDLADEITPIYVNEDIRKKKAYAELERMAFNTHFVWEKAMCIDFAKERRAFKQKEYSHHSSLDYVLALKCKLFSFGIDLDKCTFTDAAEQIDKMLHANDNNEVQNIRNTLIWLEHRRWVLEKVCNGWRAITNLQECASMGTHQDKEKKRHACICRSAANLNLMEQYSNEKKPIVEYWDGTVRLPKGALPLDELDTMSLELHRAYLKEAERQKKVNWNSVGKPVIDRMDQLLSSYPAALQAWKEFCVCMIDIWHGEQNRTYHYKGLKQSFEQQLRTVLNKLESETAKKDFYDIVDANLHQLDIVFRPILASAAYQDFKYEDVKLVDEIPFILTFATPSCMVVPYMTGNSSMLFQNVAAALKVNPTDLVFLHHCNSMQEVDEFCLSIGSVVSLLHKKNITAKLEIYITCLESLESGRDKIEKAVKRASGESSILLTVPYVDGIASAIAEFRKYLKNRKNRGAVYAIEENMSNLSWLLRGAGIYNGMAHYQFDAPSMSFSSTAGCPMFGYISKPPFLSVADIISLSNSRSDTGLRPEFFDSYRELWRKSREENSYPWKNLCSILKTYADENDKIAVFKKKQLSPHEVRYEYTIAVQAFAAVTKILNVLIENRIISNKSKIIVRDTESCHVTIFDCLNNQPAFNDLFRNQSKLFLTDNVSICIDRDVKIFYDDYVVMNASLNSLKDRYKITQVLQLLRYLRDNNFIYCYTEANDNVSFSYASRAVKQLLTNEGRILELYVYHKLKDSYFDDVVSGYEVSWQNSSVRNEFDCIVTKGFSSLFIECKARSTLSQDHYFKLAGLTQQFGVNARAILVADTRERTERSTVNDMQRNRGKMMGIITIWKEDEIENIDHTLLSVLDGTYKQQ